MIELKLTTDKEYIKSIFMDKSITQAMRDDSIPDNIGEIMIQNLDKLGGFFLKVIVDTVPAGLFWLRPTADGLEAHTALLGNCRGRNAIIATKRAIAWCFEHTETNFISSYAWSDSPTVAWFCRAVGMLPGITENWPNTRNGKPVTITYFKTQRA